LNKKVLVFGASNSRQSINKKLAGYAASQLEDVEINLIDLNDYEMSLFSVDKEANTGIPELAHQFKVQIKKADAIIISLAEHNGAYTAAYKNIYDWTSRIEKEFWHDKPMLLLATSPGPRGGKNVLELATKAYSYSNHNVVGSFSLPSFYQNFSDEEGISDETLRDDLMQKIQLLQAKL